MPVKGVLLDLDGTIYEGGRAVDGAAEAIERLWAAGIELRFTTNTTRRPVRALVEQLSTMGIAARSSDVLTAPRAASRWLVSEGLFRVYPLLLEETWEDLSGLKLIDADADAVLVGDLADRWDRTRLDRALQLLLDGARLVAVQKNRYGCGPDGIEIDAGAFVAALEYSAGVDSVVVGKPNPEFFRAALEDIQLEAGEVVAVGDDLRTDVRGAQAAGVRGILVRTGKYRPADEFDRGIEPDAILDSVNEIPTWLGVP
jgi:HAD superfamily hydrolase (TIGR01458 family)